MLGRRGSPPGSNNGGGRRPGGKTNIVLPEVDPIQVMLSLARAGLNDEEICLSFGFTPSQWFGLMANRPDLKEMIEDARDEPNHRVEQALFKRAVGYQVKETTKVNGEPVKVVIKEIAPDPVSCIFWLKNRSPRKWRDVIEMRHTLRDRMDRAQEAVSRPAGSKALPADTD